MRMYDYDEANPDTVRLEAFHARSSTSALYHVSDNVAGRHRSALQATDGELTLPMSGATQTADAYTSRLSRNAIWAALQVENFADAIETYNTGSQDPMSVSRLNAKVQMVNEVGISVHLCLAGPQPSGAGDTVTAAEQPQWEQQQQAAYQSELDGHSPGPTSTCATSRSTASTRRCSIWIPPTCRTGSPTKATRCPTPSSSGCG